MIYTIVNNNGIPIGYGECSDDDFQYAEAPDGCTIEVGRIETAPIVVTDSDYMIAKKNKYLKNTEVEKIIVTTSSGKTFDGDEKSQDRMLRAIQISAITGVTQTQWKLADNTTIMVTLDEMKEALSLAGNAMSQIWLR